jgi:hypothetical protein
MRAPRLCLALLGFAGLLVCGCSATLVAATVTTVGAAGVLGYSCDGYVVVTVRDPRSGRERCNETLIAERRDETRELTTCMWTRLPPGSWKIHPPRSATDAEPVTLVIEPIEKCEKTVYTIELAATQSSSRLGAS